MNPMKIDAKMTNFSQKWAFFWVKIEIIEKFDYFGQNNRGSISDKCLK